MKVPSLRVVLPFLLAAAAQGFGAQSAMINVMRRLAGRSRQMVPQTAVLGSLSIGMISGSGSANAVVVGTITIPLMKRYGVHATVRASFGLYNTREEVDALASGLRTVFEVFG